MSIIKWHSEPSGTFNGYFTVPDNRPTDNIFAAIYSDATGYVIRQWHGCNSCPIIAGPFNSMDDAKAAYIFLDPYHE